MKTLVPVLILLCSLKYAFGFYQCSGQIMETLFAFVGSQVEFGCVLVNRRPISKCVLIQNSTNNDRINVVVNSTNLQEILHPRITSVGNLTIGKCRFQLRNISIEDSSSWNLSLFEKNEIIKTFKINVSKNDAGCYAQSLRLGDLNEDTTRILSKEPKDCQNSCMTSGQCNFWTWSHQNDSGVNCQFFNNTIKPSDKKNHDAISGSKFCPGCWRFGKGVKIGNNTDGDQVTANTITECHHICEGRNNCSLFYWNGNQCIIFKNLFIEEDEIIPEMDSIIGHSNCLSPSPEWPESIFIIRTSEHNMQVTWIIVGIVTTTVLLFIFFMGIIYQKKKGRKTKKLNKISQTEVPMEVIQEERLNHFYEVVETDDLPECEEEEENTRQSISDADPTTYVYKCYDINDGFNVITYQTEHNESEQE